jgi:hypothetical protein
VLFKSLFLSNVTLSDQLQEGYESCRLLEQMTPPSPASFLLRQNSSAFFEPDRLDHGSPLAPKKKKKKITPKTKVF